jgi:hypothetical protein
LVAHLQFFQPHKAKQKNCKRATKPTRNDTTMDRQISTEKEGRRHNSTYKKLAVQWLNEALCFVSSFAVADSFVLRNRQLLVAAKRQAVNLPHFYSN